MQFGQERRGIDPLVILKQSAATQEDEVAGSRRVEQGRNVALAHHIHVMDPASRLRIPRGDHGGDTGKRFAQLLQHDMENRLVPEIAVAVVPTDEHTVGLTQAIEHR